MKDYILHCFIGEKQIMTIEFFFMFQHPQYGNKWGYTSTSCNEITFPVIIDGAPDIVKNKFIARLQFTYLLSDTIMIFVYFNSKFKVFIVI